MATVNPPVVIGCRPNIPKIPGNVRERHQGNLGIKGDAILKTTDWYYFKLIIKCIDAF